MIKIKDEYGLLKKYVESFNEQSINNETAGVISFFTILGQVFKNQFIVPSLSGNIDIRVSCFWLQDARSGKSVSWNFMNNIAERVNLVCESPTEWSDAGLIGTIEKSKDGEIEIMPGILDGCDILQIDEASSLFAKKNYNQSTMMYFQIVLNYLFSKTNIIEKQLKAGKITCKPHCSLWLTSFPPKEVVDEVIEKGFFQRVLFYPNKISIKDKKMVSNIRIGGFWQINKNKDTTINEISDTINDLRKFYKDIYKPKSYLLPNNIDNAINIVRNKIDGFYRHIDKMNFNNEKIMSSFISNFENNITIFSTLLAISRKSKCVESIDILQAYEILYEIFVNISSWLEEERSDIHKEKSDLIKIVNKIKDKDGWIHRATLTKTIVKDLAVSNKTAQNKVNEITKIRVKDKIKVNI